MAFLDFLKLANIFCSNESKWNVSHENVGIMCLYNYAQFQPDRLSSLKIMLNVYPTENGASRTTLKSGTNSG